MKSLSFFVLFILSCGIRSNDKIGVLQPITVYATLGRSVK